ncbi:hypothetical protein [Undibacterium squillarum]|uniref:Uncharacterized protein n=1 Tax=Undibacterium squillarum TaxID=1131567 RepID=A0ABQ2XWA9_9BURK|nr:hypothetical protein [Undibacterium squillarum]GGX34102.1 hypothetical protein GCM10010946_09060 [Undibacterium squillarum]
MSLSDDKESNSVLELIAAWLSRKSALVLILMMIQLGLLLAMYNLSASIGKQQLSQSSRGTASAVCGQYEVVFSASTSMQDVQQWALNFNATIVNGPNSRGAFEMEIPGLTLPETRQAFGSLAIDIRINPLCGSSERQE